MPRDVGDEAGSAAVTRRIRSILSELELDDFERVDPPAGLWDRIEASIASAPALSPKEPPWREFPAGAVVEYRIDADDVLIDVDPGWADFARDNDAPELAVPPSNRTLWRYFDSDEVVELWRLLVDRVRGLQKTAVVPLRCDAPHARRWFDMTITPEPDGRVHFRCALVFEEERSPVALLDPGVVRGADHRPVALCSWCGRAQHDARWVEIEELVRAARLMERESMPPVSHGICASCRDEMSAEFLVPDMRDELG